VVLQLLRTSLHIGDIRRIVKRESVIMINAIGGKAARTYPSDVILFYNRQHLRKRPIKRTTNDVFAGLRIFTHKEDFIVGPGGI